MTQRYFTRYTFRKFYFPKYPSRQPRPYAQNYEFFVEILFEYGLLLFLLLFFLLLNVFRTLRIRDKVFMISLLLPALFVPSLFFSFYYLFFLVLFVKLARNEAKYILPIHSLL